MMGVLTTRRFVFVALGALALLAIGIGVDRARGRVVQTEPEQSAPRRAVEAIDDPLIPGAKLKVVGPRGVGVSGAGVGDAWVTARPASRWRAEKPASKRGGIDPCDAPDPGFAGFSRWQPLGGGALYLVPESGAFDADGRFDLVMHFHGHDVARKDFVLAAQPFVMLGLSLPTGGAYRQRLAGPEALGHFVAAIEAALSKQRKATVAARRIAVTAWSGGYEAVSLLLEHHAERIDAVVLLDGLHASRKAATMELQLAPFVRYAQRAATGDAFMLVTHSSIEPGTYASTTETAHHLIHAVGGRPLEVRRDDRYGLELIGAFSEGSFHVRGYAGGGEADHCAHLALYADALRAIGRRWKSR